MKPTAVNAYILQKLGFPHPIDYDVKPDGSLAVIDSNGQKFVIPYKDYSLLLDETAVKSVPKKTKSTTKPQSSSLTD